MPRNTSTLGPTKELDDQVEFPSASVEER